MTPTTLRPSPPRTTDTKVITLVSAAHFVSHYYILVLPPLFPLVRAEFGVSYVELGAALTAFNVISAAMQTRPASWSTASARAPCWSAACCSAPAHSPSPAWSIILGVRRHVRGRSASPIRSITRPTTRCCRTACRRPRMSKAYSIHTFCRHPRLARLRRPASCSWRRLSAGAARFSAPPCSASRWRRCCAGAATAWPAATTRRQAETTEDAAEAESAGACCSRAPILLNFVFFIMLSLANGGVQNYSVVALEALHGTPLAVANYGAVRLSAARARSACCSAAASQRTPPHDGMVIAALAANAARRARPSRCSICGAVPLIVLMSVAGLFQGLAMPSRDMLVRAVTPPGSFGKVFGFVTTGFNIAGMVAPLIFGWLMDQGNPQAVLLVAAAFGCHRSRP